MNNWYGCKNIQMISHGEWSDPQLVANGYVANYWDIEDTWWRYFLDETGHQDSEANTPEVEEEFALFLQDNEASIVDDIMNCGKPMNESRRGRKTINESQLRAIVKEAVKSVITESADLKDPYYNLQYAIEDFIEAVESTYALVGSTQQLIQQLKSVSKSVEEFCTHPDDGRLMMWDRLGF